MGEGWVRQIGHEKKRRWKLDGGLERIKKSGWGFGMKVCLGVRGKRSGEE